MTTSTFVEVATLVRVTAGPVIVTRLVTVVAAPPANGVPTEREVVIMPT